MRELRERKESFKGYLDKNKRQEIALESYRVLKEACIEGRMNIHMYVNLPRNYFIKDVVIKFFETENADEIEPNLGWGSFDLEAEEGKPKRMALLFADNKTNFSRLMQSNSRLFYDFEIGHEIISEEGVEVVESPETTTPNNQINSQNQNKSRLTEEENSELEKRLRKKGLIL